MENPTLPEIWKKKCWTVEEKAQIVCLYLKDHVDLADLAKKTGSTPGLILPLAKLALEGIEQAFSQEMQQQRKVLHREILEKDDRIQKLESVVSELSTENPLLKKIYGPCGMSPSPSLMLPNKTERTNSSIKSKTSRAFFNELRVPKALMFNCINY